MQIIFVVNNFLVSLLLLFYAFITFLACSSVSLPAGSGWSLCGLRDLAREGRLLTILGCMESMFQFQLGD